MGAEVWRELAAPHPSAVTAAIIANTTPSERARGTRRRLAWAYLARAGSERSARSAWRTAASIPSVAISG